MQGARRHDRDDQEWSSLGKLSLVLMLVLGFGLSLSACGGKGDHDSPESPGESVGEPSEVEDSADPDPDAAAEDDPVSDESADEEAAVEAPTDEPTEAPTSTDEPEPTEVPTEAPTDPPTAVPATLAPTEPPAPTAEPEPEWFVEFYPDNWTYQIPKDQLCAGINWRSAGVTDLVVGRVGNAGESVEAEGKKGDNCFSENEAEFFLEYKRPDGQVERKEFKLERTKNKSD